MKQPTLSLEGGALRDAGIEAVTTSNQRWHAAALKKIRALSAGRLFDSDLLHHIMARRRKPHKNTYGAVICHALDLGLLEITGIIKSIRPEARSRRILQYRRTEKC